MAQVTLITFLQQPLAAVPVHPPPQLGRNTTNQAYSYLDIRGLQIWQGFNLETILQQYHNVLNGAVIAAGPPGVGKTFTVEATSERFRLPLYSISAGELFANHGDPLKLDVTLDRIFKIARHFNAILLLDEADVFIEKRSAYHDGHNHLMTVFLRKLEYYKEILFLTINCLIEFNEVILS
ncbi:hypothetical protein BDBG_16287 [Blastomyces gilchristii SLH14081]|uniref:ATPase AAA-type core domain-containing protein n=1 Tax=Blastomyces gilchristii (strain SLH14081) TaxID=559298 RepID=A0A179U9B0_BLAGS|nr:uncharacterized protein BDBG_16287 [Blastomyces gilchristii SLH14081]OAT04574.1 hypothetical protein BDBG_16287 [Blastomyces gilchristii SLH14081]